MASGCGGWLWHDGSWWQRAPVQLPVTEPQVDAPAAGKRQGWTPMDWLVPALERAVDAAESRAPERATTRAKVWHDNEKFLLCPSTYTANGLTQVRFPPNSGDLNPIETVWARLRQDLAAREQEDLSQHRVLTKTQFKQRVAQLLSGYGEPAHGQELSYLSKLVRGMPKPLAKCRARKYGRCGK